MARYDTIDITLTGTAATSQQAFSPSINGGIVSIRHVVTTETSATAYFPSTSYLSVFGAEYGLHALTSEEVSTASTTQYIHPRVEQNTMPVYVNERLLATIRHGTATMGGATPAVRTLRFVIDGQVTRET